jgi:hypothetical protein
MDITSPIRQHTTNHDKSLVPCPNLELILSTEGDPFLNLKKGNSSLCQREAGRDFMIDVVIAINKEGS